jgi:hypothetical protein
MALASLYDWLLLLHIVAAMVWLGGLVALSVISTLVLRGGEFEAVARFVAGLPVIGPLTLAPASAAVVGFGAWLVVDSRRLGFRANLDRGGARACCSGRSHRRGVPQPGSHRRAERGRGRRPSRGDG